MSGDTGHTPGSGQLVAMVFDEETANAVDCFDYTVEELQRRADELRGGFYVTRATIPCWPPPVSGEVER